MRSRTLPFELSQARKNPEDELSLSGGGVDPGSVTGEHLEADPLALELVDEVDEMPEIPPEAVELPDNQVVPLPKSLQTGLQPRSGIELSGGVVLVEVAVLDTGLS